MTSHKPGDVRKQAPRVLLNTRITAIRWQEGEVVVITSQGEYRAPRAVITLPLGVLQAGNVKFTPPLEAKKDAFRLLSMGPVIRVSLCFQKKFWEEDPHMRDLSFLFTDNEHFPTWWTSNPLPYPILTGWAATRHARALTGKSGAQIIEIAVNALAGLLGKNESDLKTRLEAGFPMIGRLTHSRAALTAMEMWVGQMRREFSPNPWPIHCSLPAKPRISKAITAR